MLSTTLNNRAAIVSKESKQCNFFGSHIGKPNDCRSNWLQTFNSRNKTMLDSVFILRLVALRLNSMIKALLSKTILYKDVDSRVFRESCKDWKDRWEHWIFGTTKETTEVKCINLLYLFVLPCFVFSLHFFQ